MGEKERGLLTQFIDTDERRLFEEGKGSFVNGWVLASWVMVDTFMNTRGTIAEILMKKLQDFDDE